MAIVTPYQFRCFLGVSVITVQLDLQNNLSYIIRTDGEFVPAMPDDDQFSPEQITK